MNIPIEVARAQGVHGAKGAAHGIKGGRPRLDLTDEERTERRRKQHEAYRRRNGIIPETVLSREERRQRNEREHQAQPIRPARQHFAALLEPVAPSPAVGRNQPCPCGSGRKFKKCCGP
jgi:preprotein translocase subunit SecA